MNKFINNLLAILFLAFAFLLPSKVYAGTDLTVTCANEGLCDIAPASTPLFNETNMMPGDELEQTLTIINNDIDDTCNLILDVTNASPSEPINLAERIFAAINDGTYSYFGTLLPSGRPSGAVTYQDLYDVSTTSLGSLAPLSSREYTWYADFDVTAGNEYQNAQSIFDFEIAISCSGGAEPTPTPSPVLGTSTSGGGEPLSNPGPASPPVCNDSKPSGSPTLTVTNTDANTVNLSWDPVAGATHYALEFYRISDGAPYGAANIGNVTSYTVTNLSGGGASYRFYVRPVNGCMPGDLSNESVITPTGGITQGRPAGEGGQVLGETTQEETAEEIAQAEEQAGQVLGENTCSAWIWYIPWILLLAQALLVLGVDYYLRKDERLTKHYLAAGITLASIAIFYLVRECPCYVGAWWFFVWLCKWYWIVSLLLTLILKAINYAFIEEAAVRERAQASSQVAEAEKTK